MTSAESNQEASDKEDTGPVTPEKTKLPSNVHQKDEKEIDSQIDQAVILNEDHHSLQDGDEDEEAKDGQVHDEKQVRTYQRVFDKGSIENFMKRGPQRIDLRDHSTACPIGLYFMQDDDSDDDGL